MNGTDILGDMEDLPEDYLSVSVVVKKGDVCVFTRGCILNEDADNDYYSESNGLFIHIDKVLINGH